MGKPPYPRYVAEGAPSLRASFPREAPDPSSPYYGDIRARRALPGLDKSRQDMRTGLFELNMPGNWRDKGPGYPSHDLPGGGIGDLPWSGYAPGSGSGASGAKLGMSPLGQAVRGFLNKGEKARFGDLLHRLGLDDPAFNEAAAITRGKWGSSSGFAHQLAGDEGDYVEAVSECSELAEGGDWTDADLDTCIGDKLKAKEFVAAMKAAAEWVYENAWSLMPLLLWPVDGDDLYHANAGLGMPTGMDQDGRISTDYLTQLLLWNLLVSSGKVTGEWIWGGGPEDDSRGGSGGGSAADVMSALLGGVSHPSERVWGK